MTNRTDDPATFGTSKINSAKVAKDNAMLALKIIGVFFVAFLVYVLIYCKVHWNTTLLPIRLALAVVS